MAWQYENGSEATIAGIQNWQGAWALTTAYKIGDGVENDGTSYVCTAEHTSDADKEPGTGADWADYWDLLAQGASGGSDADAIHDNVASEISAISEKETPVNADLLVVEDSADSNNKKKVQIGNLPASGAGEANTASNVGTDGVGVYKQKTALDLEFKNIAPASNKITVTANGDDIDIDITEANLTLSNIGGAVTDSQVPNDITLTNITQITNRSHTNLADIGSNTHAHT